MCSVCILSKGCFFETVVIHWKDLFFVAHNSKETQPEPMGFKKSYEYVPVRHSQCCVQLEIIDVCQFLWFSVARAFLRSDGGRTKLKSLFIFCFKFRERDTL